MSLAVLKRKTKETYKTKKGTFSLNGTKRNLSYVGKNYSGMTRNPYCFTNSTNIKKSVGSQTAVIRNLKQHTTTSIDTSSCANQPRTGTIQKICNNWVQRIEPDGNKSQAEYIKKKRILATTIYDTSLPQSDSGNMCAYTRIGGKLNPSDRYVDDTTKTMTSEEYNSVAISKRATICPEEGGGWQKPFPYTINAGDAANCSKNYTQADQVFDSYYKAACNNEKECV
jgi:hypothetical protein